MTQAAIQVDAAVYGTQSCPLTRGIREWLGEHEVPYDFFDIENDAGAEERVRQDEQRSAQISDGYGG